jgi:hypothetical protein
MATGRRNFFDAIGDSDLAGYQLKTALIAGDIHSAVRRWNAALGLNDFFELLNPDHWDQLVFDSGATLTTMHGDDRRLYLVSKFDLNRIFLPLEIDGDVKESQALLRPNRPPERRWQMAIYVLLRDFGQVSMDDAKESSGKLAHFTDELWRQECLCPLGGQKFLDGHQGRVNEKLPDRAALRRAIRDYLRRPEAYPKPPRR